MTHAEGVPVATHLAIRQLVSRYCQLRDDRNFDALVALFTEGARYRVLDRELEGRRAIRAWLDTLPDLPMFHHVGNVVVTYGSQPGTYHAHTEFMSGGLTDGKWAIWMVARFHDTFTLEAGELLISRRSVTPRAKAEA